MTKERKIICRNVFWRGTIKVSSRMISKVKSFYNVRVVFRLSWFPSVSLSLPSFRVFLSPPPVLNKLLIFQLYIGACHSVEIHIFPTWFRATSRWWMVCVSGKRFLWMVRGIGGFFCRLLLEFLPKRKIRSGVDGIRAANRTEPGIRILVFGPFSRH